MSNHCLNIKNDKICFVRSTRTYVHLVWLAHLFGWKPKGTWLDPQYGCYSEEEIRNWNGSYFLNEGQIVDDDARAMGDALYTAAHFYRDNVWWDEKLNEKQKRAIWDIIYNEEQVNNDKRNMRAKKIIEKYLLKDSNTIVLQKISENGEQTEDQCVEVDKEFWNSFMTALGDVFALFYCNVDEYNKAEVFEFFAHPDCEITVWEFCAFCRAGAFRIC